MDRDLVDTVPSALSGTATGVGYSHDTLVLLGLAQYVINLGYRAVATMNDTALAIPCALKAGLGEYGRHGLLITKEFGPRVRIGKIFTDLPLAHDRPTSFGVTDFCETCRRWRGSYAGASASTRRGLPLPPTILSGAAITIAPVAGSRSRLHKLASPSLPAPCIVVWFGNGGSKPPA